MSEIKLPILPAFTIPEVRLDLDLPTLEQVRGVARDAAFVGIGVFAITAQRLSDLQADVTDLFNAVVADGGARLRSFPGVR
jgi:hypothetical protein